MINAYNHNSFLLGDLPDNKTNVKQEMIANARTQLRKDAMLMLIRGILIIELVFQQQLSSDFRGRSMQ